MSLNKIDDELKAAEAICAAATAGPWSMRLGSGNVVCTAIASDCPESFDEFVADCLPDWALAGLAKAPKNHLNNMAFIIHARTAYPEALAEIRRLQSEHEKLEARIELWRGSVL